MKVGRSDAINRLFVSQRSSGGPSPRCSPDRRVRPKSKFRDRASTFEVGQPISEICLRIGDGAIVNRRCDFFDKELENQAGLQLPNVLIELFEEVAPDRSNRLLPRVIRWHNSHGSPSGRPNAPARRQRDHIRVMPKASQFNLNLLSAWPCDQTEYDLTQDDNRCLIWSYDQINNRCPHRIQ